MPLNVDPWIRVRIQKRLIPELANTPLSKLSRIDVDRLVQISGDKRGFTRWEAVAVQLSRCIVERIVATPAFVRSARLSSLLLFVTRHSLQGHPEMLSEQLIGQQVFGRAAGYDSRDDNIVRSHASRLRQRLDVYFRED